MSRPALASDQEIAEWLAVNPLWTQVDGRLRANFAIGYDRALKVLMHTRSDVEDLDHHPLATVSYEGLEIELWTHDRGGVTQLDFELARRIAISAAASAMDDD